MALFILDTDHVTRKARKARTGGGILLCQLLVLLAAWTALTAPPAAANDLERELGRSESRILSAPYPLLAGRTVRQCALAERLDENGYRRVHDRPKKEGEYFWGKDVFWIFQRAHRLDGEDYGAELFGLALGRGGEILHGVDAEEQPFDLGQGNLWLEPEVLSEAIGEDRALKTRIVFDKLPKHVWQAVLAAEDARFFEHGGVDARSLARALIANLKEGKFAQGGSTITQQLIKNRDMTPKRSLTRKASEAVRALTVEMEYDKEEILEAYLNQVYFGHVDGLAVHGLGTAARVYFSKDAGELDLAEAATLAAMIQGPNRLSPERHDERLKNRRDWVLGRLEELGWSAAVDVAAARRREIRVRRSAPRRPIAPHFRRWVAAIAGEEAPRRVKKGRGLVAETELDPYLQRLAEDAVAEGMKRLQANHRTLRRAPLGVALVALDAETGGVLAYVGGDGTDELDRARNARRQPGSTVKPLLLLEAFESCGRHGPLYPAARVSDQPLRLELPSGDWTPQNDDGRFHGTVDVREALRRSLNVPFVRIARWCGLEQTAQRLREAGLRLEKEPPPSFALGAVETSPLELAGAYTVFATPGEALRPRALRRLEKPDGGKLEKRKIRGERVVHESTAWLVRDLMLDAARGGTASAAAIEGLEVAAKTGTSSERRDAWLAGTAGSVVTVVWVGRDDSEALGLTGTAAAAPIWKSFMERAVEARPAKKLERPEDIVTLYVDSKTGLLVRSTNPRARPELFRRGATPRRDRFFRPDRPVPVID